MRIKSSLTPTSEGEKMDRQHIRPCTFFTAQIPAMNSQMNKTTQKSYATAC